MDKYIIKSKYCWDGQSSEVNSDVALYISDGRIAEIGKSNEILNKYNTLPVIGGDDILLLPAFTNAHDHGRGVSPVAFDAFDRALEMWLQDLNKLPCIPHYEACYYDGLRLVSTGVGTVLHSHNPNSFANIKEEMVDTAHGYMDAGVRSILCPLYLDQNKRIYYNREQFLDSLPEEIGKPFRAGIKDKIMSIDEYFKLVEDIAYSLKDEIASGWTELQLHPNGGQWCSDEALLAMKDYALSHNMYIHLHLLETKYQREYAMRTWNKNFIKHYNDIGFLGPWVSFAHSVYLDEEDFKLISQSGAKLVNNPSSNLRLRSGSFDIHTAHRLGVSCGIGLDGCAYDDDQDYLREIRTAWLNNSQTGVDGEVDYMKVLKMATVGGASIDNARLSEGVIKEGSKADLVLIDSSMLYKPYVDSYVDPLRLLVQKGTRDYVATTIVNGKIVWNRDESFKEKEALAANKLADSIKAWRLAHPGRRNNEELIKHVHDFYKDVK